MTTSFGSRSLNVQSVVSPRASRAISLSSLSASALTDDAKRQRFDRLIIDMVDEFERMYRPNGIQFRDGSFQKTAVNLERGEDEAIFLALMR